ncbi:MAG: hypothetical protein ACREDG_05645 [Methylocella sp.]
MIEYLVVAFRHPSGGWVAVPPDFVGVTGRALDMQHAIDRAATAATQVCAILAGAGRTMPVPCDLAGAPMNHRWAAEYGIDRDHALIESVWLSQPSSTRRRRSKKRGAKIAEWSKRATGAVGRRTPLTLAEPDSAG